MRKFVCAVYDAAAQAYNAPFVVPSLGLAERSFRSEVQRVSPENVINAHPEDFDLFCIAVWDDETCVFGPPMDVPGAPPARLLRGVDCVVVRS